jgi:predicted site-specific integrase-resolvase
MQIVSKPQLLNNDEAAEFLGISPGTLVVWRCEKRYPVPYLKVGRKVLYDVDDLVAWLQSRKMGGIHAT